MKLMHWAFAGALVAGLGLGGERLLRADDAAPAPNNSSTPAASSDQSSTANPTPSDNGGSSNSPSTSSGSPSQNGSDSSASGPGSGQPGGPSEMGQDNGSDNSAGADEGNLGPAMQRMQDRLGLTDDQAQQMKAAMKKNRDAMKPLREKMKGLIETLKGQVDSKAADSDISGTLDALDATKKSLSDATSDYESQLRSILKPAQAAQLYLFMARQHMGGGMMRGEHHHGDEGAQGGQGGDNGGGGGQSSDKY